MWNLGEKNKGVDAGAVGLVHWDRDVQEAVSPPHLDKTLSKNEILKLLARDCLHSSTWMFLHLDILHLDISHLDIAVFNLQPGSRETSTFVRIDMIQHN